MVNEKAKDGALLRAQFELRYAEELTSQMAAMELKSAQTSATPGPTPSPIPSSTPSPTPLKLTRKTVVGQFARYFGSEDKLDNWQRFCRDIGIEDDLKSVTQCRLVSDSPILMLNHF